MHLVRVLTFVLLLSGYPGLTLAQETVFNVPSGDVLEKGKVYGELDFGYQHSTNVATFVPRIVVGAGHKIEMGANFLGPGTAERTETVFSPTIKWKIYDGSSNGWAFLVGNNFFVPLHNRTYDVGNYVYAEFAKSWNTGTRATFGAYQFTHDVVAAGNRLGGQFAIEQQVNQRLTAAADWYTGDQSSGFVTTGVIVKITSKVTWYGSYQFGNHRVLEGNNLVLTEIGWNVK